MAKVVLEVRDHQSGNIIEKDTCFQLYNCDTKETFFVIAVKGEAEIELPLGDYCVKQEQLEQCDIIVSDLFYTTVTASDKKIEVKNVRPLEIGDFGIVEKEFFKVLPKNLFWSSFEKLQKEGKNVTGVAKHLYNGKSVDNLVIVTLQ
jgi:hypothetical protein